MTTSNGVAERLRAGAVEIDNDGTASQVGPTADELREAADRIEALERELYLARNERDNARDHVADAEAQVMRLTEALTEIANHVPKSIDFSAPSDGFEFCKRRARAALVDNPSPAKTSTGE